MTEIHGRVISGKGQGNRIGFPTANLSIESARGVEYGVYAAKVLYAGRYYAAIANVGIHPTLAEGPPAVEIYILDEVMDLYGKELCLILTEYIRPEKKFGSVDELKGQISCDVAFVRKKVTA